MLPLLVAPGDKNRKKNDRKGKKEVKALKQEGAWHLEENKRKWEV